MPDNACTLVPTVFRWHAKMEFKFHFYFSFSRDIEKQIWILLFVFRFRLNFEKPIWTSYFVFRFRITSKNGYKFRFSFSHYFEKRIWISFFVFVWLVIEKQIWISFVVFAWLEKRISAPVQSFEVPGHAHPRGWPAHSLFMQVKASEFYSPWGQSEKWTSTPPPPPPSWYVLQTRYSLF